MIGRITFLDAAKEYGYIQIPDNVTQDIAFYPQAGSKLEKGMIVEFDTRVSQTGKIYAVDITPSASSERDALTDRRLDWYKNSKPKHIAFLKNTASKLNRNLVLNPDRADSPTAPALYDKDRQRYVDLQIRNTPYFLAKSLSDKLDPRFTVTLYSNDYQNYSENYPDCDVYFHVDWTTLFLQGANGVAYSDPISVEPLEGVWAARFSDLRECALKNCPQNGQYYYFDLRDDIFECLFSSDEESTND